MAIYAIKRYSGLGNQEIGTLFGGMHYSAATKASARLQTEMAADNALRDLVEKIVSSVNRLPENSIFGRFRLDKWLNLLTSFLKYPDSRSACQGLTLLPH